MLEDEISRGKVIRVGACASDFLVVLLVKKGCQAKYLAVLDGDLRFHMDRERTRTIYLSKWDAGEIKEMNGKHI